MSQVRVVTVCQAGRSFRTADENRAFMLGLLDRTLALRPGIVVLPETFTTVGVPTPPEDAGGLGAVAETLEGPTVRAVGERARRGGCHVVCPILTRREGRVFNSAVLVGPDGGVLGVYDKRHPVTSRADYTALEKCVTPGAGAEPPVFDLPFGRVGVQICFDAGFPEDWASLARQGARLLLWPSAYDGGFPLAAYAMTHRVYVVTSVRTDRSRIIDPCGTLLARTDHEMNFAAWDINLDFAVCHYDFNRAVPDRIRAAYGDRVAVRSHFDAGLFLVEPNDDALTVSALQAEFGFETADAYHDRHRAACAALSDGGPAPPQAARHGDRPMYGR